jgi:hypothetical protein
MKLYAVLRRSGWRSGAELEQVAPCPTQVALKMRDTKRKAVTFLATTLMAGALMFTAVAVSGAPPAAAAEVNVAEVTSTIQTGGANAGVSPRLLAEIVQLVVNAIR